jgi:hypothetical protein
MPIEWRLQVKPDPALQLLFTLCVLIGSEDEAVCRLIRAGIVQKGAQGQAYRCGRVVCVAVW